jgi:hypothetical protein
MTVSIVVYCNKCDYFRATAVSGPIGTHGCMTCGGAMAVYVARGSDPGPDYTHLPPVADERTTE